eukprot:gene2137-1560_t
MSTSIEDLLNSVDSDEDISLGGNEELDLEALLKGDDDDDDEPLSATTISILKTTKSLLSAGQSPSVGNSAVDLTSIYASANLTKKTDADARQGGSPVPRDSDGDPLGDILRDVDAASGSAAPSIDLKALQRDRLGNISSHDQLSALASTTPAGDADDSSLSSDSVALLQAELREQRALNVPEKIGLSALQIRRANSAGVISNMTSVEEVGEITKQLLRNGSYEMHGPGTATTMAICNKFVAVGTVKGFVILFDHKQEIRRVLSFQQALQATTASTLSSAASLATGAGPAASKVTGPAMAVTSLDVLSDGSGLLAAHRSGDIFFWDTVRGTIVRQLRDPHGADIVGIGFLPSISLRETRINGPIGESDGYQFVTWSANHVINRFRLARSLLTTWHVDADCLLDDRSGPVVSMSICKPCPVAEAADADGERGSVARVRVAQRDYVDVKQQPVAFQFFAFGFAHQTCVVQVQPEAPRPTRRRPPPGGCEGAARLGVAAAAHRAPDATATATASGSAAPPDVPPELAAATAPGDDAPKPPVRFVPVLTRCRGRFIEVLAMRAYRPVAPPAAATPPPPSPAAGAASDAPAATAAASMATALRRSSLQLFGGFMSGVSATAAAVGAAAARPAAAAAAATRRTTRARGARLVRLRRRRVDEGDAFGVVELKWINSSQLIALTPREALLFDLNLVCLERVPLPRALCDAAVATGAATAALVSRAYSQQVYVLQATSLHRVVVKSALDQVNALVASGRWLEGLARLVDAVAKSPPLLQTEAEHIRRFIHNYALLAVKRTAADPFAAQRRASAASFGGSSGGGGGGGGGGSDHFQLVASVCVEYCVATRQLDVLCGEVLEIFRSEAQQAALLEALEPWIVAGSIRALPPRVVAEFLECAVAADRLRTVERCVPHFDPHALDLDFVARFLFAHRMLSPFLYVYAYGVGDVAAAFLSVVEHVAAQQLATGGDGGDAEAQWLCFVSAQAEAAYKLLLFAWYVFRGRVFPRGTDAVYSIAAVWALLAALVAPTWDAPPPLFGPPPGASGRAPPPTPPLLTQSYPTLRLLAAVDRGAVFFVLRAGLARLADIVAAVAAQTQPAPAADATPPPPLPATPTPTPIATATHAAFETRFEALATRQTRFYRRQSAAADERLAALQALHDALARNGFHLAALRVRAAAALPQLSVAAGGEAAAVAAVVAPRGDAAHALAFRFLDTLLAQQAAAAAQHATVAAYAAAYAASLAAVRRVLADCYCVDVARTARLVVAHLLPQLGDIVAAGDSDEAGDLPREEAEALRLSFLLAVLRDFAATAPGADVVSAGHLRERDLLVVVRLLAAHQPDALVGFLRDYREHCPLDECLEAARAGGVYDAVAFLLERAGDVSGALTVLLQDVSLRARQARRDVDTQLRQDAQAAAPSPLPGAAARRASAASATAAAAAAAGDLCERAEEHDALRAQSLPRDAAASGSGPSGGSSEELWFRALDHLLAERHLLRGGTISSASEAVAQCLSQLLQSFLARLLSSGRVSPTAVLTRVVSHASAAGLRLSECRDIVLAMLRGQEHDAQQRGLVCGVLRHDVHVLARHRQAQHKQARAREMLVAMEPATGFRPPYEGLTSVS